ncbi:DUF3072 domain-containing protein [Streptomyces sp. LP05-1]|uniref:DUF3072 domain-containing protein n=1 Tax=Streptomyces pyxinae TaxID=2970734 RepID=A0ABT2CBS3_9ACTN|nr:DUF3072 domain-containing protein [Streptomyces sp. LP05-1]MCS0634770.1 DUF3072 domain-containing protein [Streptomyces sp. LP05-1]
MSDMSDMSDTHNTDGPNGPGSTNDAGGTRDAGGANGGAGENPRKDVEEWVTGDEPATGPQLSYLRTLAREAGEDVPETLTKAEASRMIDRLQGASPRTGGSGADTPENGGAGTR